ncbi:MAG: hypothetical protein RR035_09115, partial [Oscillibacter sp.]
LIHPSSAQAWLELHRRVRAGETEVFSEILVVEEGLPIWKKIHYHSSFDASGHPTRATGIAENISVYKNMTEHYSLAATQCGVTIWTLDVANRTLYDLKNSSHMKIFDTLTTIPNVPEAFAAEGSPLYAEDYPALYEMFQKVYAGEKTATSAGRWWNETHDSWWWYEISYTTIFDENERPVKAIGTAIEITERIRLEERYEEELNWRKVHNQDVLGSFKLNLTQNICEDGQSDIPAILTFQGDGTVDGFFAHEYAAHVDEADLAEYKKIFNRENLLQAYRGGKTSVSHETYMSFWANKVLWIKVELDMFLNPRTGDVEAYIYATDIDQKKMSRALVDAVVKMDFDYLALLDIASGNCVVFAETETQTRFPSFHSGNYREEVETYARKYLVEEDVTRNIRDMSVENLLEQLARQPIFTAYCRVK